MAISESDIERMASLARIQLTSAEKEKYAAQLGGILDYINKLSEVKTDAVEPTAQVTGLENVLREDEPGVAADGEKMIAQFPHKKGRHLKVKSVFVERK